MGDDEKGTTTAAPTTAGNGRALGAGAVSGDPPGSPPPAPNEGMAMEAQISSTPPPPFEGHEGAGVRNMNPVSTNNQAYRPQNETFFAPANNNTAAQGGGNNNMTNLAPQTTTQPSSQVDEHAKQLQDETERLQKEIEALKKLQKLKQEEQELKRWLAGQGSPQGQPSYEQSPNRQPSYGSPQRQPFYDQQWEAAENKYSSQENNSLLVDSASHSEHSLSPTSRGLRQIKGVFAKRRFASRNSSQSGDDMDIEGQQNTGDDKTRKLKKKPLSVGSQRLAAINASTTADQVPIKVLLRKIAIAIMTDLDDETLQREDTETILIVITLLKEAMLGIIIAFVMVSFILFIDHYFLLNLPTARNFRKATFAVMNDQVTLRNFEENAGLKFLETEEYEGMIQEIAKAGNKTKLADSILSTRSTDLINIKADEKEIREKVDAAMSQLGLDQFCGECKWGQGLTCEARVSALSEKYQTPKFLAMMSAMQKQSCRTQGRSPKDMERIFQEVGQRIIKNQQQQAQGGGGGGGGKVGADGLLDYKSMTKDEIVNSWSVYAEDYCMDCEWEDGMMCGKRASYLNERYGTKIIDAYAMTMMDTVKCTNSHYQQQIDGMGGFCGECQWGFKAAQTCQARVDYLTYTYRNSEAVARLAAMEKPACRKGG